MSDTLDADLMRALAGHYRFGFLAAMQGEPMGIGLCRAAYSRLARARRHGYEAGLAARAAVDGLAAQYAKSAMEIEHGALLSRAGST